MTARGAGLGPQKRCLSTDSGEADVTGPAVPYRLKTLNLAHEVDWRTGTDTTLMIVCALIRQLA
jgi:hypothetical protein